MEIDTFNEMVAPDSYFKCLLSVKHFKCSMSGQAEGLFASIKAGLWVLIFFHLI